MSKKTIRKLGLTKMQVLKVVREWYLCGMYHDILQNGNGADLEEIIDDKIDTLRHLKKSRKNADN